MQRHLSTMSSSVADLSADVKGMVEQLKNIGIIIHVHVLMYVITQYRKKLCVIYILYRFRIDTFLS